MNKKYQVFVSSTFEDLKEARKKVQEVLLTAECIPMGMEAFVADNNDQFNVIKSKIDLCDYYILIIGKRYGSINPETQKSYTEMEYDYAIERSIPVLVFSINDNATAADDNDAEKARKLAEFRERALKNRMACIWDDINDLAVKVVSSIANAKVNIARPGWVRAGKYNNEELLEQLNSLRLENSQLHEITKTLQTTIEDLTLNNEEEKFWDKTITMTYTQSQKIVKEVGRFHKKKISYETETKYFRKPWYAIYEYVAPFFYKEEKASDLKDTLIKLIGETDITISDSEVLKIKHQMLALKYIELHFYNEYYGGTTEKMNITKKGLTALNKILLTK